jgi:hypothetical protein
MKTNADFLQKFLTDRDDTGRYIVTSYRTGKKYFVEPIENGHPLGWGDVNPASGKVEGDYGHKNRGGIKEKDSMITKENGFEDIRYSGVGGSPMSVIDEMDSKYPTIKEI